MTLQEEVDKFVKEGATLPDDKLADYGFRVSQFRQRLREADREMTKMLVKITEEKIKLSAEDHSRAAPIVFPVKVMPPSVAE